MAKEVKVVITGDGSRAKAAFNDVQGAAGSLRRGVGDLNSTLSTFGAVLGGAGIVAAVNSATAAAVQMERATVGLAVTARYAGAGMAEASQAAKSLASDGLMSVAEASQGLQNLLSRGFGLEESIQLMERFKDSAAFNRQASREFGDAIVQATEGLKNENSILVDNAGVTKNVSVMWAEYARQIGVGEKSLTQAQKRQAEYSGILRETEGQLGNAALMTDTYQGAQARLNQEIFNAKVAFGQSLAPALTDAIKLLTPLIGLTGAFIGGLQMMAVELFATMDKVEAFSDNWDPWGVIFGEKTAEDVAENIKRQFAIINAAAEEQKMAIVKTMTGGDLPVIGSDSGARRKDIVTTPSGGGIVKAAQDDGPAIEQSMEIDAINARVQAWVDGQAFLRDVQREEANAYREEYFANLDIEKQMELDRINSSVDAWIAGEEMKKNATATMRAGIGGILGDLSTLQNSQSRKAFEIGKAASIANATVSTYEGATKAYSAMAGIPIIGPALGIAAAAAAIAAGMANVQAISSQKFGGGGGGRLSVGGAGGFAGVASSPVVTQPAVPAKSEPSNTVSVTILGNVVDHDKFAREVIPSIQKAFADGVTA